MNHTLLERQSKIVAGLLLMTMMMMLLLLLMLLIPESLFAGTIHWT
jgi:hypothetical protein